MKKVIKNKKKETEKKNKYTRKQIVEMGCCPNCNSPEPCECI